MHHGYECASVFEGVLNNIYRTSAAGNAQIPSDAPLTSASAQHYAATVIADVIQVQWQLTDRGILSLMHERKGISTSAPKAVTGAAATTVTATPTHISTVFIPSASSAPPSATRGSNARSSGLSAGFKVTISVLVPVGTLILLGIGLFLLFRRRKAEHKASSRAVLHAQGPMDQARQEMDVHFPELPTGLSTEIAGSPVTEIGGRPVNEIGGRALHAVSKTYPRYPGSDSVLKSRC